MVKFRTQKVDKSPETRKNLSRPECPIIPPDQIAARGAFDSLEKAREAIDRRIEKKLLKKKKQLDEGVGDKG